MEGKNQKHMPLPLWEGWAKMLKQINLSLWRKPCEGPLWLLLLDHPKAEGICASYF